MKPLLAERPLCIEPLKYLIYYYFYLFFVVATITLYEWKLWPFEILPTLFSMKVQAGAGERGGGDNIQMQSLSHANNSFL